MHGSAARVVMGVAAALGAFASAPRTAADDAALRPLVERLSSPDASARAEAACELGRRGKSAAGAVDALTALLPDGVSVGPVECGMSPWLRKQLEAHPEDWRRFETSPGREAAQALARVGRPALRPLMTALAAASPQARAHAAYGLGEMDAKEGRAEALPRLIQTARDPDERVREAVARALGEIQSAEAVPVLLASLRDSATAVRAVAAWALGEIGDKSAVEPLMRALWDREAEVRSQAAWALGEMRDKRAALGLMGALKDKDARVRRQVAWALGEIQDARAVEPLVGALQDGSGDVREQAAWALGELKGHE
jgi:HEAT repeat protein